MISTEKPCKWNILLCALSNKYILNIIHFITYIFEINAKLLLFEIFELLLTKIGEKKNKIFALNMHFLCKILIFLFIKLLKKLN